MQISIAGLGLHLHTLLIIHRQQSIPHELLQFRHEDSFTEAIIGIAR